MINVEDMDTQASESADETQVYREIKEKLGIQVVRMEYKPRRNEATEDILIDEGTKKSYRYFMNIRER